MKKRFIRLALINVVSNLMVPLAGLIDTAFLGHLDQIHHLAGVAIAGVLFSYIYWTFGFLRMGTTGMTAQAQGRGDRNEVILILLRNCAIALTIGTIILILQQPLKIIGFTILQAEPAVLNSASAYYNTLILGAPGTLLNFVLLGWLLGREKSNEVLLLSVVDKGANIALDYLFIVRFGWEAAGAGLATAISHYLNLLVGLILVWGMIPRQFLQLFWNKIFYLPALKKLFSLNRDILIRTLALVSTFALFTNFSAVINTNTLAANTLLLQVVTLAAYFIDGIAFATESIIGYLQGQKNYQQLSDIVKLAGISSLVIGISIAALFGIFPQTLFGILTDHDSVISQIDNYVWWLLPVLAFGSIAYMLDGYFLGLTAGKVLRNSTIIACCMGFLPMGIVAFYLQSSHLLWLALTCFMATRVITLSLNVKRFSR